MVHNWYSRQKGVDVTKAPDDPTLDAVDKAGVPTADGRPAGPAIQYYQLANRMVVDYAIFVPGSRRITATQSETSARLTGFRNVVKQVGGCKCRQYFGVQ